MNNEVPIEEGESFGASIYNMLRILTLPLSVVLLVNLQWHTPSVITVLLATNLEYIKYVAELFPDVGPPTEVALRDGLGGHYLLLYVESVVACLVALSLAKTFCHGIRARFRG